MVKVFTCKVCKVPDPTRNKTHYCKRCYAIILRNDRYRYKQQCVDYKGGSCCRCGYNKSIRGLDFHHMNPEEKSFGICQKTVFTEEVMKELDKCTLLCSNCHRETEEEIDYENFCSLLSFDSKDLKELNSRYEIPEEILERAYGVKHLNYIPATGGIEYSELPVL